MIFIGFLSRQAIEGTHSGLRLILLLIVPGVRAANSVTAYSPHHPLHCQAEKTHRRLVTPYSPPGGAQLAPEPAKGTPLRCKRSGALYCGGGLCPLPGGSKRQQLIGCIITHDLFR